MSAVLTQAEVIAILKAEMPDLQREYGVEQLAVYGSFVKGKQKKVAMLIFLFNYESHWV